MLLKIKNIICLAGLFSFLGNIIFLPMELEASERKLQVAASTAMYADLVRQVGGDRVEVKAIAAPRFNIHFYQPKPSDVRNVAKADLFVTTGLDLEAWSPELCPCSSCTTL